MMITALDNAPAAEYKNVLYISSDLRNVDLCFCFRLQASTSQLG